MNKMSKIMKLCPLHKQPNGLKIQCGHLLEKYFGETLDLLVLKSLGLFCFSNVFNISLNTFITL